MPRYDAGMLTSSFYFFASAVAPIVFSQLPEEPILDWQRTYGGAGDQEGSSVVQVSDGGYVVAGSSTLSGGDQDIYLLKLDGSGDLQWDRTYSASGNGVSTAVVEIAEGGYLVAGWTSPSEPALADAYLMRTDPSGNRQWEKTYGEDARDAFRSVAPAEDGGLIAVGYQGSYSVGDVKLFLVKTDRNGVPRWEKKFSESQAVAGNFIRRTTAGDYVVAGDATAGGELRVYLARIDGDGGLVWEKLYGEGFFNSGMAVVETAVGFVIAGGTIPFFDGTEGLYLIGTDAAGEKQWERKSGTATEMVHSLLAAATGGFVVGSTKANRMHLARLGPAGDFVCEASFGGISTGLSVIQSDDEGIVATGRVRLGRDLGEDVYLLKVSPERPFLRGDSNHDDTVDISDAIGILQWLFVGADPPPCLDAADADDNCLIDLSDAVFILQFRFKGGVFLSEPYPAPGLDSTPDLLGCGVASE